jgi:hypothetical protein
MDWTVTTPSVTAAPDGPERAAPRSPAACAATRLTEAGRGTSGYYVERPAQARVYACRKASSSGAVVDEQLRLQERERRSSPANIRNTFQKKLLLRCPS